MSEDDSDEWEDEEEEEEVVEKEENMSKETQEAEANIGATNADRLVDNDSSCNTCSSMEESSNADKMEQLHDGVERTSISENQAKSSDSFVTSDRIKTVESEGKCSSSDSQSSLISDGYQLLVGEELLDFLRSSHTGQKVTKGVTTIGLVSTIWTHHITLITAQIIS